MYFFVVIISGFLLKLVGIGALHLEHRFELFNQFLNSSSCAGCLQVGHKIIPRFLSSGSLGNWKQKIHLKSSIDKIVALGLNFCKSRVFDVVVWPEGTVLVVFWEEVLVVVLGVSLDDGRESLRGPDKDLEGLEVLELEIVEFWDVVRVGVEEGEVEAGAGVDCISAILFLLRARNSGVITGSASLFLKTPKTTNKINEKILNINSIVSKYAWMGDIEKTSYNNVKNKGLRSPAITNIIVNTNPNFREPNAFLPI